jgi:hypothetical protein
MYKFIRQLHLDFLDVRKPLPLIHEKMVYFLMQMTYFQFCFEIHTTVLFRMQAISCTPADFFSLMS